MTLAVPLASAIATELSILTNFLLNDRWTFRGDGRARSLTERLLRYNGVALGGLAITAGLLTLLTTYTTLPLLIANLLAIAAATVWNYVVNSRWTWGRDPEDRSQKSEFGSRKSRGSGDDLPTTDYRLPTTGDQEVAL